MKKKTFLVTLFLFIVFINSSMLIVSFITLRERLAAEREKVLAEHYVISSGLIKDMQAVDNRGGDVEASMDELMRTYARYSQNRDNELAVSCDGKWIWWAGETAPTENPGSLAGQANQSGRMVFVRSKPSWKLLVLYRSFGYSEGVERDEKHALWSERGSDLCSGAFSGKISGYSV